MTLPNEWNVKRALLQAIASINEGTPIVPEAWRNIAKAKLNTYTFGGQQPSDFILDVEVFESSLGKPQASQLIIETIKQLNEAAGLNDVLDFSQKPGYIPENKSAIYIASYTSKRDRNKQTGAVDYRNGIVFELPDATTQQKLKDAAQRILDAMDLGTVKVDTLSLSPKIATQR